MRQHSSAANHGQNIKPATHLPVQGVNEPTCDGYRIMQRQTVSWLIPILLASGAAGALWYYWLRVDEPVQEPPPAPQPVAEQPQAMPEPVHPVPDSDLVVADRPELVPLPPLDQSDDYFKLALSDIFGSSIESVLASSRMIERIVATVDSLPRSSVAERIRPIGRLGGQFVVDGQDDSGEFNVNSGNYDRYTDMVDLLADADLAEVAAVYRRFYPLFQSSYVNLGYPNGYFNDRLVEVIDHLLATPDIDDSALLVRPHVLYEYADPDLESLSSGQKLLLRMGRANRTRVKQVLKDFRDIATQL